MKDSLLEAVTSLTIALVAAVGTGPMGRLDLPSVDLISAATQAPSSIRVPILDLSATQIATYQGEAIIDVQNTSIPAIFRKAIVAIEDRRLGKHVGVDAVAVLAAASSMLVDRRRGGSTLSQQLVKNHITGNEVSLKRKLVEAVLSVRLTRSIPREAIVDAYISSVWLGRGTKGALAAAKAWFGRDWKDLTVGEVAFLAGLPQGPSRFDQSEKDDEIGQRAVKRRNSVIAALERDGYIEPATAARARSEKISLVTSSVHAKADVWVERAIAREIASRPKLRGALSADGISLITSINSDLQRILRSAVHDWSERRPKGPSGRVELRSIEEELTTDQMERLRVESAKYVLPVYGVGRVVLLGQVKGGNQQELWRALIFRNDTLPYETQIPFSNVPDYVAPRAGQVYPCSANASECVLYGVPQEEISIVAMEARSGRILAIVGGSNPEISAFDRSFARRQLGSVVKPFLWLAALEEGIQPTDIIKLQRRSYSLPGNRIWSPRDSLYGSSMREITFADGLIHSSNLAAIALAEEIGLLRFSELAYSLALSERTSLRTELSSVLGGFEASLVSLTAAYAAFANGGNRVIPHAIVGLRLGEISNVNAPQKQPKIAQDRHLTELNKLLRGVVERGTAAGAFRGFSVPISGKTGTTDGYRDAWFVGYTPELVVGVWIGRDDGRPMSEKMTGGTAAAKVVREVMHAAYTTGLINADGFFAK